MFLLGAMVDGVACLLDSAQIVEVLLLFYWFWGGLVAVMFFVVLVGGLYVVLRNR